PAHEGVDQRALTHTARPEQGDGRVVRGIGGERVDPFAGDPTCRQHRYVRCRGAQRIDRVVRTVDQVSFGQHDDRAGTAVPCQHQLALQPTLVGRRSERVHQHYDVDVGGERL